MKILYHHRIASKDGQYVHVEEIIKAMRAQGHEVKIVAPNVAEKSEFGSDGGWVSKLRANLPQFCTELLEFTYAFYVFFKLCYAIVKHKPDGIYERYNLFLPAGIWAKKLFGLKLILEVNSPLYKERKQYGGIALDRLAKWTEVYAWRNADLVLPVTNVLAGYVKGVGVPANKITVLHNGIDPVRFNKNIENEREQRFQNKLVVGFVGFCREWHKLDEILGLLAEEKNERLFFLVVGDGPVADSLKQKATSLGISDNFHITGLVEREDMPYWLDQIDIAIQSAVTPWCSPLKLIEYLAKGKAIVAPDADNIQELLSHNENAVLFDHENPSDLIKGVREIINDELLRKEIQQNAVRTIEEKQLTWDNNARYICDSFSMS